MAQKPVRDSEYTTASIKVLTFANAVRARPGMYFGYARDNAEFVAGVVRAVIADAMRPSQSPEQRVTVDVVIEADLRFSVADDVPVSQVGPDGRPGSGMFGSVIPRDRPATAAAAAVSVDSVVEVWVNGRGWRQQFVAALTLVEPQDLGPTNQVGMRATFELDPTYVTAGATIPRDLAALCATLRGMPGATRPSGGRWPSANGTVDSSPPRTAGCESPTYAQQSDPAALPTTAPRTRPTPARAADRALQSVTNMGGADVPVVPPSGRILSRAAGQPAQVLDSLRS